MHVSGVLSQLVYISRATSSMSEEELRRLVRVSAQKNAAANITGALLYHAGWFLQVLEGDPIALSALYHDVIALDPRHVELERLSFTYSDRRAFPNWSMRSIDLGPSVELSEEDRQGMRAFAATALVIAPSKAAGLVVRSFESVISERLSAAA
jgi:hypothetical protein